MHLYPYKKERKRDMEGMLGEGWERGKSEGRLGESNEGFPSGLVCLMIGG